MIIKLLVAVAGLNILAWVICDLIDKLRRR